MAKPSTRVEFKNWCLRKLGHGAIEINVTDNQVEDRIDEALIKFGEFHSDGQEHLLTGHVVSNTDISNRYITTSNNTLAVVKVFRMPSQIGGSSVFTDVKYQWFMQNIWNLSASQMQDYVFNMTHLESITQWLNPAMNIRFSKYRNRIYIDSDWSDIDNGEYLLIEEYRTIDANTATQIYSDEWLLQYATALIKKQWASNLQKYQEIQMLGGVTLSAQELYQQAETEIEKLEEEIRLVWEYPPIGFLA